MSDLLNIIKEDDKKYLFQNYGDRMDVSFSHGAGAYLYDQDGKEYIDFFSGIAVSSLGYAHPALSAKLHQQIDRIIHSSNWYYNAEQIEAAKLLSDLSFIGKTLFVNSGTEAIEAAIKCARRYGKSKSETRSTILTFDKSFHGRTYGSMSATGQDKIKKGFDPLVPGFVHIPYNNVDQLMNAFEQFDLCAVIIELVQGEGGIRCADQEFIKTLAEICTETETLLIIDEIQTGIARTGKPFAYQHYDFAPDIITIAKGLGGGVPIGAIHAKSELSQFLPAGAHGTTFGGNHLACSAAQVVLHEISKNNLCDHVNTISSLFNVRLSEIKKKTSLVKDIRGMGLLIGIELSKSGTALVKKALENGLIINCTADTVIRIAPPLIITEKTVTDGLNIFESIINQEW